MKYPSLVLLILLSIKSFAGGFSFPNVSYSHARLYLFNTGNLTDRAPEFSVYRDGIYAASKLGNGWEITTEFNENMNAIFSKGVDALAAGLSSCYTPRHGIIYFDTQNQPVASLSICFECQRIFFWSSVKLKEFNYEYSPKEIPRAERQLANLETLFIKNGIPVFKNFSEYPNWVKKNDAIYGQDSSNYGGIVNFYLSDSILFKDVLIDSNYISNFSIQKDYRLKKVRSFVTTLDGPIDCCVHFALSTLQGTELNLLVNTKNEPVQLNGTIVNSEIRLPNGISVGMSLDQIQAYIGVWDGLAYPSLIVMNYKNGGVAYQFTNRTLTKISFNWTYWN